MISQIENEEQKIEESGNKKLIEQLQKELQDLKDSKAQELLALREKCAKLDESFDEIKNANHDWEYNEENQKSKYRELKDRVKAYYDSKKDQGLKLAERDFLLKEILDQVNSIYDDFKPDVAFLTSPLDPPIPGLSQPILKGLQPPILKVLQPIPKLSQPIPKLLFQPPNFN